MTRLKTTTIVAAGALASRLSASIALAQDAYAS